MLVAQLAAAWPLTSLAFTLNDLLRPIFGRTAVAVFFAPIIEEALKRVGGRKMQLFFSVMYAATETVAMHVDWSGPINLPVIVTRCFSTHVTHLAAGRGSYWRGVAIHAIFNSLCATLPSGFAIAFAWCALLYVVWEDSK